jgi:hypothetical protein
MDDIGYAVDALILDHLPRVVAQRGQSARCFVLVSAFIDQNAEDVTYLRGN